MTRNFAEKAEKHTPSHEFLVLRPHEERAKPYSVGLNASWILERQQSIYRIATPDASVITVPKMVIHNDVTTPVPGPPDSARANCVPADDHFWEMRFVAPGTVRCDLSFMILDRSCQSQGCFLWQLEATITAR